MPAPTPGEDGWYDADDGQWRAYRGSFVTLLLAAGVTTALTRRIKAEKPTARLACGLAFVAVAHGGGAGCVVGVCGLFHAASFLPPALAVPAAWALALACLGHRVSGRRVRRYAHEAPELAGADEARAILVQGLPQRLQLLEWELPLVDK